jgi:hypothetical protein
MGEPCHQQKLPDNIKKPLRITLTLFSKWGEIGSLDPLWRALLSPRMFKIATIARVHSNLNGFTILSDNADLSITFPYQLSAPRTFAAGCIIGAVSSMVIFNLTAISFSWIPVIVILGGFAGLLVRHHTSTELLVRGDLPDVIAGSDVLASWLSAGRGRKVRLEGGEKVYLETEAQKPDDIQTIFKAAITLQDQES